MHPIKQKLAEGLQQRSLPWVGFQSPGWHAAWPATQQQHLGHSSAVPYPHMLHACTQTTTQSHSFGHATSCDGRLADALISTPTALSAVMCAQLTARPGHRPRTMQSCSCHFMRTDCSMHHPCFKLRHICSSVLLWCEDAYRAMPAEHDKWAGALPCTAGVSMT